jgi:hypothetical protein
MNQWFSELFIASPVMYSLLPFIHATEGEKTHR